METIWQDVRFGLRMLVKSPAFTVVAVLTLALGVGANTAIFSVINAVLLQPLSYEDPDRLVFMTEWSKQVPEMSFSVANFKDVRDQSTVFESLVAYNGSSLVLTGDGEAERVNGRRVTAGVIPTLRLKPILGRAFTPEDDRQGAERVAMLSDAFWARRFGRDPKIIGQTLNLSGDTYTVIGVLTSHLHGSWRRVDVYTPLLQEEDKLGGANQRGNHPGIYVLGRMKPGIDVKQARSEVVGIATRLGREYQSNTNQSMTLVSLHEAIVGDLRPALLVLLGAVAFVLLIACANVASLLLGRAGVRQREIAVRTALGAGRMRLVRQMLVESMMLAALAGFFAVPFAYFGLAALSATTLAGVPRSDEIRIDVSVLAFTAALSLVTGIVFGLAPAFAATRANIHTTLKEGGRGSAGPAHGRLRAGLVIVEVALSVVLLVGAGLLLRSFFRVLDADPGFRADGVLVASVSAPAKTYDTPEKIRGYISAVNERVRAMPGVLSAASTLPLLGGWQTSFSVEGVAEPPPGQRPSTDISRVSPDYFKAMGVRILRGRALDEHDQDTSTPVCVVDETFAATFWPQADAIGKHIRLGAPNDPKAKWMEVVGVAAHVKNYGVDQESRVETYLPAAQNPIPSFTVVLKTTGDPTRLAPDLREAVRAVDPNVPIYDVRSLDNVIAEGVASRRVAVVLISVFAILALALSAVGLYGVMSYTVTQRTREIGVRMALGAQSRDVLRLVVGDGMLLAGIGLGVGLAVALGLAQLMTALLFQVRTTDPPTYAATPLLLTAIALLACYVPARRASSVDPLVALREE